MRPAGDVRQVLAQAAQQLHQQQVQPTWRDLAEHACVGYAVAKYTVCNMRRDGWLQTAGQRRTPHSRRPMAVYVPARGFAAAQQPDAAAQLGAVLQAWGR